MLQDKTVLLGICACTPAYKALDLIAMLKRKGADVKTAATENGTNMVPVAMPGAWAAMYWSSRPAPPT